MMRKIFNHKKRINKYTDEDKIKFQKVKYVKNDLDLLNRLLKSYTKKNNKKKKQIYISSGGSVFKPPIRNQEVTFRMSYSNTMQSHNKYINYYMPQENKEYVTEKPVLFGMSEEEYDRYKVPLNFKCIISPESQDIDLETLVESYIKRVELQTGYKLCWRACIHQDTDHRHAHVVINGKDLNGEDVYFNKDTIYLMRLMCSNAATQMIGERTREQILLAQENSLRAKRWTDVDEKIDKLITEDWKISRKEISNILESRLMFLSELKLAKFNRKENCWELDSNYKNVLTVAGRYNTYLDEYFKDPQQKLEIYTGGYVEGKVEKVINFDKDEAWNDALIVNTDDNRRVYIPVWQLHKENLEGKKISINKNGNSDKISRHVTDKDINISK